MAAIDPATRSSSGVTHRPLLVNKRVQTFTFIALLALQQVAAQKLDDSKSSQKREVQKEDTFPLGYGVQIICGIFIILFAVGSVIYCCHKKKNRRINDVSNVDSNLEQKKELKRSSSPLSAIETSANSMGDLPEEDPF